MRELVLLGIVSLLAVSASAQMDGTAELIAVSPAGAQLWKWEGGAAMHTLAVAGGQVIVVRGATTMMMGNQQQIVALSLSSGTVQWRRDVTGVVSGIRAEGDRVYVVTGGMPAAGRVMRPVTVPDTTLVALHAATGAVLWTTALK
jgi:outer membrane protein assembly factor BamB